MIPMYSGVVAAVVIWWSYRLVGIVLLNVYSCRIVSNGDPLSPLAGMH